MPERRKGPGDDYVQVDQRLQEFLAKFPEGRVVTADVDFHVEEYVYITVGSGNDRREVPALKGWVLVKALAYRTPDDPLPGVGWSQLIMPGGTPYTRGSELENCETSAWGRAIAAVGIEVRAGIASAEEIRNKVHDEVVSVSVTSSGAPQAAKGGYAPNATAAQISTIGSMSRELEWSPEQLWSIICDLNQSVVRESFPADATPEEQTRLIKLTLKGMTADDAGKVIVTMMALKAAGGELVEQEAPVPETLALLPDEEPQDGYGG